MENQFQPQKRWKKGDPVRRPNSNPDILEGLPSICRFFGKCPNTITNWIKNDGLPASKTPQGKWITHKTLLLQWMYAGHLAEMRAKGAKSAPEEGMDIERISGDGQIIEELAKVMGVSLDGNEQAEG